MLSLPTYLHCLVCCRDNWTLIEDMASEIQMCQTFVSGSTTKYIQWVLYVQEKKSQKQKRLSM